jgi:hypothetical protein
MGRKGMLTEFWIGNILEKVMKRNEKEMRE